MMGPPPSEMLKRPPAVFFSKDFEDLENFAASAAEVNKGSRPVLLRVELPPDIVKKMKTDEYLHTALRYPAAVPAKYITAYKPAEKFTPGKWPPADGVTWGAWHKFDPSKLAAAGATTFYTFILCRLGLEAYSPDEERDAHGRWTAGLEHNLNALSRTVKGQGRGSDRPQLAKSGEALADQATENFHKAAEWVWQNRNLNLSGGSDVYHTIAKIGSMVNEGLLQPGQSLWRMHEDVAKGYTPSDQIQPQLHIFCDQLAARLQGNADPKGTAAWAEHEFNVKIHPLSDGMGRATTLLTGLIMLQQNHDLPRYDDRDTFYKGMTSQDWEKYYRGLFGVEAYSPDQPRDNRGRWVGGDREDVYVSPNQGNLQLDDAYKALGSDHQKSYQALAQRILDRVTLGGRVEGALGVWADGAENSLHLTFHGDNATAHYIGALLGKAAHQKDVLDFVHDPAGKEFQYVLSTKDDLSTINKKLQDAGIAYRTIVLSSEGSTARIYDSDGSMLDAVGKLASDNGYKADVVKGTGTFLGSDDREEAAKKYDGIIQQYEQAHPDKAYRDSLDFQGRDQSRDARYTRRGKADAEEIFAFDLRATQERIHAAISTDEVVRRIRALPTVPTPKGKWSTMRRSKQRRYGASVWKENPLTRSDKPADAEAFKRLPVKIRDHIAEIAPLRTFDPNDLKSNQPAVYQSDLEHFAHHGHDPEPVIILKTREGLYVHNGNHRSTVAKLSGRRVKAKYVDLSKVKEIQAMIGIIDGMLEARNIFAPEESAGKRLSLKVDLAVKP